MASVLRRAPSGLTSVIIVRRHSDSERPTHRNDRRLAGLYLVEEPTHRTRPDCARPERLLVEPQPPSSTSSSPDRYDDASLARKSAVPMISSADAIRRRLTLFTMCSCISRGVPSSKLSVWNVPQTIALTRIP